eukprot:tig00020920_g15912.t1
MKRAASAMTGTAARARSSKRSPSPEATTSSPSSSRRRTRRSLAAELDAAAAELDAVPAVSFAAPVVPPLLGDWRDEALAHLSASSPKMRDLIERVGPPPPSFRGDDATDTFSALSKSIIFQQLAGSAAKAIEARYLSLFGTDGRHPSPAAVAAAEAGLLLSAGLSKQKAGYLQGLARACAAGELPLELAAFGGLEDGAVAGRLRRVKGVGPWTADMFLLFTLERRDVLPVGDLGVRKGVQEVFGLRELPKAGEMERLTEAWRPWRSIGSWYMWRAKGTVTL